MHKCQNSCGLKHTYKIFFALQCDSTIIPSEQLLSIVVKAAAQKQSTHFRQMQFYSK